MLKLTEVKSALKEYHIYPARRLGQNFLIDEYVRKKIVDCVAPTRDTTIIEIGSGLGALTDRLCKLAGKVIAIEKDRRLCNFLRENIIYSNLELIQEDILNFDFSGIGSYSLTVVGNLPFYISSPILAKLLDNRAWIGRIFITVQKEFAERLVATPGTRTYGAFSCFVQFYTEPEVLFIIKKCAFYPAPEVDAAFVRLIVRTKRLYLTDEEKLFKIIKVCFGKRRKTVLNALSGNGQFGFKRELSEKLKSVGISPVRRPETLSLKEFVRLTGVL